jgi:hypothetical protein
MNRLIALIFVTATAIALPGKPHAHSWYPNECCHDGDCAPVDKVDRLAPASGKASPLIVTTRHGTAVVPSTLPIQQSKDHRMHACMRPSLYEGMGVICIFMPPDMY